jgi:hypothetical protein
MRYVWSVLCGRATTDRETNNVSLIDVIEQIDISVPEDLTYPVNIPFTADLVTLWARPQLDVPFRAITRFRFLTPTGTELGVSQGEVDLETTTRLRQHLRIQGLRIGGTGWHEWEISWRPLDNELWTTVARIPLEIRVSVSPEVVAPATA